MSSLEIVEVGAGEERLLPAWHAVYDEAQRSMHAHAVPWELDEVRAELVAPRRHRALRLFALRADREVVAIGQIGMPMLDNTRTATLEVGTAVGHRRRGHGSAMLAHLLDVAREHGRSTVFVEIGYPLEAGADGGGRPGPDFATARGFAFALGDVQRELPLPMPAGQLDRLAAELRGDYRVEAFAGPVPERWLASYVGLDAQVSTEAPMGELDLEPEVADVEAWREAEELAQAQGRRLYSAVALDPDDTVVAYTLVTVPRRGQRSFQWGTLVDRAHRGHRLGLAVKAANVRQLQRAEPGVASVLTYNAESNAHMVAINERLGFRPVARLGEFQRRI